MARMISLTFLLGIWMVVLLSAQASASALQDVPEAFADALGVSDYTAKMIFAVTGLVSVSMVLAVFRVPIQGFLIIELALIGLFVALTWLDAWLLVLAAIIVAVLFAAQVKGVFSPDSG